MIQLHPSDCACGDCRNRRLICGLDTAAAIRFPEKPMYLRSLRWEGDRERRSAPGDVRMGRRATDFRQV